LTITALTPQKRRQSRTSVFIDGNFFFGMDNADLNTFKLSEGMEISKEQLNFLLKKVVCVRARDTALRYISARPRSRYETERKLLSDGYPEAVINYVLRLMLQYRYIDDAQYAKDYTASRFRQGYGAFRVKMELKRKGIDENHIEAALSVENDEIHQIKEWIRRKKFNPVETDPKKRKRFIDAMMRRGFSYGTVREALVFNE
jgi:regulatory protein